MTLHARSRDEAQFTPYHAMCVQQMNRAALRLWETLK
jgi:hypothetical protein